MSSSPSSQAPGAAVAEHLGCRLTVRVHEVAPGKLTLTYRFDNHSGRNAYLFNLLPDRINGGIYQIDPNHVSVEVEAGRATIGKKIVDVPPMTFVEKPEVPSVTKVTSGASFEETLEIPLPLMVATPYSHPYDPRWTPPMGYPVDFELGFFLGVNETERSAQIVESTLGPVMRFDSFPFEAQQLLRVEGIAVGVPTVPPPKSN